MALVNLVKSIYTATDVTSLGELTSTDQAGLPDGTAALPSLVFSSDTDSGLYRIGANNIGLAVGGNKILDIATTGLSVTGVTTIVKDGTGSTFYNSGALLIKGATNGNKLLSLGFDTTNNLGFIQSLIVGDNLYNLSLNPNGGNVLIGTTTDAGTGTLQVAGAAGCSSSGYLYVIGNGSGFQAASKFAVDVNSSDSRLYASGVNASTNGTFTFHSTRSDGTNDLSVATISSTGLAVTGDISVSTKTPASAGATGVAGTITWDANYIYVCTATNTWKRVAIATW